MPRRLNARLRRIETALPLPAQAGVPPPLAAPVSEDRDLAQDLARSFGDLVAAYRKNYSLTLEEARQKALDDATDIEHILTAPPEAITWCNLDTLERHAPGDGRALWERIKEVAVEELRNGSRAARVLEGRHNETWFRARFLAVRSELQASLKPRSPVEVMLIDQLAQWQTLLWETVENVATYTAPEGSTTPRKDPNMPELPRLSVAEALESAMNYLERLHQLYLRTLKALQDQRRVPAVRVQNARQVNVGGQQVNVSS